MKIKGLHKFISEVNDPKSAMTPEYRIQLELLKIKKSLLKKKKKKMYNTKKCVAKLCYIELYGCHVAFGFPQVLTLLRSLDLSDIFFGCLATVILIGNNKSFIAELIPEMRRFLSDTGNDLGICFALNAISCIESAEMADSLGPSIADIVIQPNVSEYARKKAMLTLAKIYQTTRQYPSIDRITPKLSSFLLSKSSGIVQCASTLILSIIRSQSNSIIDFFPIVIDQLYSIFIKNEYEKEIVRGKIPCPFLAIKLFKILMFKSDWTDGEKDKIESVVTTLLNLIDLLIGSPSTNSKSNLTNTPVNAAPIITSSPSFVNYSSFLPSYMIFSEISDLASSVVFNKSITDRIIQRLISLIQLYSPLLLQPKSTTSSSRKQEDLSNENDSIESYCKGIDLCYFALDKLNLIIRSAPLSAFTMQPIVPILASMMRLRNILADVRALDLLYAIATNENGIQIAEEMIDFLPASPLYLRESLGTKAAVLIQSYGTDDMNSILILVKILKIGDKSLARSDIIWRFIVQTVYQKPSIQKQATEEVYDIVKSAVLPGPPLIKSSSFLIGEYFDICSSFNASNASELLFSIFKKADEQSQSMVLMALMKIAIKSADIRSNICNFFKKHIGSLSYEVAQRSKEYAKILSLPEKVLKKIVLSPNSSCHVINDIFATKTVKGEIPVKNENGLISPLFEDRKDITIDDKLFNHFQSEDTGILLQNAHFIIRAAVRYDQPRLSMIVNIENLTTAPVVIKNFTIDSNDELRYRIVDIPFSIDSRNRSSIAIDFVMMDMTSRLPVLNLTIDKRVDKSGENNVSSEKVETVSTPLPIFFNRWFLPFDIDEESFMSRWASIVDPQMIGGAQLVIPDGDVIEATVAIMKKIFGLEPLKFELAKNNIVAAGAFKCFSGNIGVLLRFVYDEDNMDFSFHVKANMKSAVKVIVDMIRNAFLS